MSRPSAQLESDTFAKKYDVVVSGMGVSGLASAWQAVKRGKTILMVSNHLPDSVRMQRVYLKPDNRDALLSMLPETQDHSIEDRKFIAQLKSNYSVGLKDIERFIKRQLDRFPQQVQYVYESQFAHLDMKEGKVTIESLRGLPNIETAFDDVIAADGTHHHAVDILNASKESAVISYSPLVNLKYPYHLSGYIKLERKDGQDLILPDKDLLVMTDPSSDYLCFLHFNKDSLQNKKTPNAVKCQFLSEIPQDLYEKMKAAGDDPASVALPYIEASLKKLFIKEKIDPSQHTISIVKPSQKHGVQKDKLKLQCFKTSLMQANTAALTEYGKRFITMGDGYATPNYQVGHGVVDALMHAGLVGEIFDGKRTLEDYTKAVKIQTDRVHEYGKSLFLFPMVNREDSAKTMEELSSFQMSAITRKYK